MPGTPRRWLTRFAAAVAGLLLAVPTGAPAAAQAVSHIYTFFNASAIAAGTDEASTGKVAAVGVFNDGGADIRGATVVVDAGAAAGVLAVSGVGDACTTAGAVTTCRVTETNPYDLGVVRLRLKVADGASVGDVATLTIVARQEGHESFPPGGASHQIRVVESAPDLGDAKDHRITDVKPGVTFGYRPAFRNNGDQATTYVGMWLRGADYFGFATEHRNCYYPVRRPFVAYCEFPFALAPGERAQTQQAVEHNVRGDVFSRWDAELTYEVDALDGPQEMPDGWAKGTGPELTLTRVTDDAEGTAEAQGIVDAQPGDGIGIVRVVTGANPADLVAVGGSFSGAVGAEVSVTVGMRNAGPADLLSVTDGEEAMWTDVFDPRQPSVTVTLPEGVGVLEVPGELRGEKCFPVIDGKPQARRGEVDGRVYYCSNETFNLGSSQTRSFEFRVKIINATVGTGSVKAAGGTDESDPSNNTAKITYAGAAGGGDQNGDDGDDGDAGDDSAGAGGGTALPITGSASGVAAGLGLLLFTAGAGLYLMARRRRIRFTAGD